MLLPTTALAVVALLAAAGNSAAGPSRALGHPGKAYWAPAHVAGKLAATHDGRRAEVRATKLRAFTLDASGLEGLLRSADGSLVVSLPDARGGFQRFELRPSHLMAPGLAQRHPEITTYRGRGLDDPTATIHADLSPLGFHASVRSAAGAWYIDPYYRLDRSVYASYYGRDVRPSKEMLATPFVERDAAPGEVSVDNGYYHAGDTVTLSGAEFDPHASVTLSISDPEEQFATRTLTVEADGVGAFEATFVADPGGNLRTHIVEAAAGDAPVSTSYEVVDGEHSTDDPPTGDVRRTYRLALITDPGYAAFQGGPANVTAAKVALINRVSQVYEDDLSISLQLIANNDLLNLNTWADAIAPNGPCGNAACFSQSQVTGCSSTSRARFVIGQIIGASNYDIGHLALGQPGGGVANLGVVGRSNKAGGCTGIPTPTGDFYAIDYVAHEMGHQFSGNHPFNGNQLNCSGGNRSAANSVEVGSGSSIMAYAGICLTDDLQPHSDPYFSERSLQEISTYTSSNQAAINEVQTASLRHFGGGNEVQAVTFGPGYSSAATIQPLSLAINAAPGGTSRGGAMEDGNTVTIATGSAHTLQVGDTVAIAGVGVAGYNGTFAVTAVPSSRSFQYTNPTAGLARSGGGTVTLAAPGATESGTTVTIRTAAAHGRSVGDVVTLAGAGSYNGTWTITGVPTARSFQFTHSTAGLADGGGGTATFFSPFRVRIGGNDSNVIGGSGVPYNSANLTTEINAIPGFAGTVTVSGAAATGFTVAYGGASADTDVPNIELVNLSCGGCFASVEETNHGGANDSFTLNYNGNVSAPIVNGTNYTAAGIQAALAPILPAGATATVAGFGGGAFGNTGFQVTYAGSLAATNVPVLIALQGFTAGASGWVGETDKGGAVDNKGGIVTSTGNTWPSVTAPVQYTIPLRTPFALTGSATDTEGDGMTFSWEQNDRGASPNAAGTSLLGNTKTNGPLFAMFPRSGRISETDTLLYNSPGENHLTSDPTRVFPDLQQILDNNTNAVTGACPDGPIAPPVPVEVKECFAEFLPTADYVGVAGTNDAPLSLHFRFTARDGKGGTNSGDTTLLLANTAGPFLVTAPNTSAAHWTAGSTRNVTWDVANTNTPMLATDVKISLSTDGGYTYPWMLAASTPNDGSQTVTVPNVGTTKARIKVEAVGNVFFDLSDANFTVTLPGIIGLDSVSLGGKGALVDSFDASAGPYGPANKGDSASVFSNSTVSLGASTVRGDVRSALGPVSLDKGGLVTGDVTAGGPITSKGTIQGTATQNSPSPPIAAPPVAACSPFSDGTGISGKFAYSPATGDLAVSGGKTATLAGGAYCFHSITLSGGSTLAVAGPVKITLTGVLSAGGGSFLNPSHNPANMQLSSSYAGANGVLLSGGAGAYLSVYAPTTNVAFSGGSPLYGAVLGKTLAVSGGGEIHYDVRLVDVWGAYFNNP